MEHLNSAPAEYGFSDTALEANTPDSGTVSNADHQRLFKRGLRWLALGAFLMLSSFAINFMLFDSNTSFVTIMYVMTSLGALCFMKCLADMLGF